jgi:glycosyltransferase involved in cell wall biosynthesis
MVSALIPSKFVAGGVRAVAALPGVHLVIAGDGPQRAEIDALAATLLPGRFTRLTTTMDRMPELYRCADAFLHLSRDEAFGNVYIEALATGLPVVAHVYPTARWILGEYGRLVDSADEPRITEALRAALAAPPDAAARHTAAAARFDWPVVAAHYADFIGRIAGS